MVGTQILATKVKLCVPQSGPGSLLHRKVGGVQMDAVSSSKRVSSAVVWQLCFHGGGQLLTGCVEMLCASAHPHLKNSNLVPQSRTLQRSNLMHNNTGMSLPNEWGEHFYLYHTLTFTVLLPVTFLWNIPLWEMTKNLKQSSDLHIYGLAGGWTPQNSHFTLSHPVSHFCSGLSKLWSVCPPLFRILRVASEVIAGLFLSVVWIQWDNSGALMHAGRSHVLETAERTEDPQRPNRGEIYEDLFVYFSHPIKIQDWKTHLHIVVLVSPQIFFPIHWYCNLNKAFSSR